MLNLCCHPVAFYKNKMRKTSAHSYPCDIVDLVVLQPTTFCLTLYEFNVVHHPLRAKTLVSITSCLLCVCRHDLFLMVAWVDSLATLVLFCFIVSVFAFHTPLKYNREHLSWEHGTLLARFICSVVRLSDCLSMSIRYGTFDWGERNITNENERRRRRLPYSFIFFTIDEHTYFTRTGHKTHKLSN